MVARYEKDYRDRDNSWNWLPLLVIPLLLLGGVLWYYNYYPGTNNSNFYNNPQPGIGGGPETSPAYINSPIPSITVTPLPTSAYDDGVPTTTYPTGYTMP